MSLDPGTRIGSYEVVSPLGAGGMGEVYRARDVNLSREVALKVLPQAFVADAERVARFQREAQLLAALHHPHIASVFGLEALDGSKVLVMELVEGESLEARLRTGAVSVDDAVAIATQIGEALAAAHDKGIVHRDLKPGNVMLAPDGTVKVLDFGLAKMIEAEPAVAGLSFSPTLSIQATMAGTVLGTAPYMSPEQARGRAVDKRTDIWSFGCVLFEMLSGTRAFDGDDITETIAAIVKTEPDWKALPATVPPHLLSIVRGCLEKDPKRRFADIAVPLYLLAAPASVAATPAAAIAAPPPTRWKRAVPIAAAALVAAALTGAGAWLLRANPPTAAVTQFTIPVPADQTLTNTGRRQIDLSQDGSRLVYVANRRLYLRNMADLSVRPIPGGDGFTAITNPTFSPDGREILFYANSDNTLKRIATSGGTAVTVCDAMPPFDVRWEEQGILFGQSGKGILRVSPNGGVPQIVVATSAGEEAASASSLPNNHGLLYSVRRQSDTWDKGRVMVRTSDGQTKMLIDGGSDGRYDGAGHLLYAVSGVVMSVPFDASRLTVSGTPAPAIEGVMHFITSGNSGAAQYSLASNGTLAFIPGPVRVSDESGDRILAIYDAKGAVQRLNVAVGTYRSPRVSPDGKNVAFEAGADADLNVWVQDVAGNSASRRLTFGGRNSAPVWSPDNQWVAFQSDREGDYAIFRQRADGSGVAERLTKPDKGVRHTPQSWSPDGKHLLLSVDRQDGFELALLSLENRTIQRFSDVKSAIRPESAFAPDGRWIVYQRSDKLDFTGIEVYVEPFPATGAKYLVPVRGGHPFWSRKGDQLFFNMSSTANATVDVRTTPTVAFSPPMPFPRVGRSEPNPATSRRNVDALPDGRVIGVSLDRTGGTDASGSNGFTVILNWLPQLTAKLAH